jgi:hypothetical protein
VLTLYVFLLALHGPLHLGHTPSGWLLPLDFVLHGWLLVLVNVAFYFYLCWIAFSLIRASEGRERLFVIGWGVDLALHPIEMVWPQTHAAIQYAVAVGLAGAIIAAVSLLLHPAAPIDTSGQAA